MGTVKEELNAFSQSDAQKMEREYLPTFNEYLRLASMEFALKVRTILKKPNHDAELAKLCVVGLSLFQDAFIRFAVMCGGMNGFWRDGSIDKQIESFGEQIKQNLRMNINEGLEAMVEYKKRGRDLDKDMDEMLGKMS